MTVPFRSPGGEGFSDQVVRVKTHPSGQFDFSKLRAHYHPRKLLVAGQASLFRPDIKGALDFKVTIRGLNAMGDHAQAVEAMIPGALGIIQTITGDMVTEAAQAAISEMGAVDTGLTRASIHPRLETTANSVIVRIGPTTFYSPLIEFGLGPHFSYGPRPFMTEAFFRVLPIWLQILRELAQVVSGPSRRVYQDPYHRDVNNWIRHFRNQLYTIEKEIGDIVPFASLHALNKPRGILVNTARVLGDIQAVVGRAVGARVVRRLEGQVTGRLIGIGSHTVFARHTVTTRITGGERIYNRYAGRYTSRFIGQSNLLGGRGG